MNSRNTCVSASQPTLETEYQVDSPDELAGAIVRGVADAAGVDPLDIDTPLYERVDTDALEQLFPNLGTAAATPGQLTFEFYGYTVAVCSDGIIRVYE
jgi:hypothetical protein